MSFADSRDEARRFLDLVWGNSKRSGDLGLFFIPGFGSLHLPSDDLASAAHEIAQAGLDEGINVYLNTCLLTEASRDKPGRGTAADTLMIAGAWADVDIAGAAHKSSTLPPDQESALALCSEMALAPTLVVDSGHGIYPWWLFDKPRRLADDDGRERARRLVEGAQAALSMLAGIKGWEVDHTSDLARILRPPGTTNWKVDGDPRPVRMLSDDGPRYDPAELTTAWAEYVRKPGTVAEPLPDRIGAGNRTHSIASLAGTLRRRNVVLEAALVAALEHNRLVCDPPLEADKVRETVRGIYARYEPAGEPLTNGKAKVKQPQEPLSNRAFLRLFSDIKPEPMRFIWKPRVLQGHLTLLAGDPGMGKGLIATALAAAITKGLAVPDGAIARGSVLWVSYEESEAAAIRPRLDVAGADVERVYQFVMPQPDGHEDKFFHPADIPILRQVLVKHPDVRLIILDPIVSYIGGDRDINQPNQVRAVLEPLVDLADAVGTGVLGIAHINKSDLSKAIYRVSNSGAFVQVARSLLGVGELPDGRRALAHIKANYSKLAAVIPYSTTGISYPGFEETVGRVVWDLPDPEIDPYQIFETRKTSNGGKGPPKAEQCGEIIRELVKDGPVFVTEAKTHLLSRGFGKEAIDLGRCWAGVRTQGRGPHARWFSTPSLPNPHSANTTESEIDLTESETGAMGVRGEKALFTTPGDEEEEGDA